MTVCQKEIQGPMKIDLLKYSISEKNGNKLSSTVSINKKDFKDI